MSVQTDLTQEQLKGILHYNPDTGLFAWLKSKFVGKMVGTIRKGRGGDNYWKIHTQGKVRSLHRLAWLYMTGKYPPKGIDHIDGDSLNNVWSNLRLSNQSENTANNCISKRNSTGFKVVMYHKINRCYTAVITKQRRKYRLGCFPTPEEAHSAYVAQENKFFGEFARGG